MVDIRVLALDMKNIGKSLEETISYTKLYLVDHFGSDYWKENGESVTKSIKEVYAS